MSPKSPVGIEAPSSPPNLKGFAEELDVPCALAVAAISNAPAPMTNRPRNRCMKSPVKGSRGHAARGAQYSNEGALGHVPISGSNREILHSARIETRNRQHVALRVDANVGWRFDVPDHLPERAVSDHLHGRIGPARDQNT